MNNLKLMPAVLLAVLPLWGCESAEIHAKEMPAVPESSAVLIEIEQVEEKKQENALNYSGSVIPYNRTVLSFSQMGPVKAVYVDEGDNVKKGQVLAKLDRVSAGSAYRAAAAMERQAQDAHDRLEKVYQKGSLPAIQWEEILSKLEQAKSSKALAANSLKNCTLKAPVPGTVGERNLEVGANATPNVPVFEIVDLENVYIRISVPEGEIARFEKGLVGEVQIPAIGEETFDAIVEKIGVSADILSKTYEVKLAVGNREGRLRPGMVASVKIRVKEEHPQVAVPVSAITKGLAGESFVFAIEDGVARRRPVELGEYVNNSVAIRAGLEADEIIAKSGVHELKDGIPVSYESH